MTPTIETILEQAHQLPIREQKKLLETLTKELRKKNNGTKKHFQETATDEEWSEALRSLGNEPHIDAPEISDEALRRENIYTREDNLL